MLKPFRELLSLLTESSDWPDLHQVFKIERRNIQTTTGEIEIEVAYSVTSLTAAAASPARLLRLNRNHWGIENGSHYRRQVTLHEDASRTKPPAFGHVMATLNNLLIGLTTGRDRTNLAKSPPVLQCAPRAGPAVTTRAPNDDFVRTVAEHQSTVDRPAPRGYNSARLTLGVGT